MERHLGAALCFVALLGCQSLLGLDEFGDRTQGTGASAGQGAGAGATGGAGANGGMGGEPRGGGGMGGGNGGEPDGGGGQGGSGGSVPVLKRVFVTSQPSVGYGLGGVMGANALCNTVAPQGTFAAWISDDVIAATTNVMGLGPWHLVDQNFAATTTSVGSKSALTTGGPLVAISVTENGTMLGGGDSAVWTGTASNGTATGSDCDAWTNGVAIETTATFGDASTAGGPGWTDDTISTPPTCNGQAYLYCFEQ